MMNLYIFPDKPGRNQGYSIAVESDVKRLNPASNDLIIWYLSSGKADNSNEYLLQRPGPIAFSRIKNVLRNYVNCEVSSSDLSFVNPDDVDEVFCGEVIFYRALRKMFPTKKLTVRFHNCFARIKDRADLLDAKSSLKLKIQMKAFYQLEKEIFKDKNVHKIFISDEDRDYYTSNFGIWSDSEVWGFAPDMTKAFANRKDTKKTKIVSYGGMQSHKRDGMNWFIQEVFLPLHKQMPELEFHLWGAGTQIFDDPANNIFGHGFYDGKGLPEVENGLFVNPDILGGGVKIKMLDLFEEGASFLSTPYGYEGYDKNLIDNKFYNVIEMDKWKVFLFNYFK